ncbi:hypothetical protein GCM10010145_28850 [Streptomyces ruber]|uniref:Uncharacterized protein n=2 Tax=Streptomyces TaxID=1883 RepID=A0A918EQE2_9ACTN|nr:hypothetical protein [Streptomyces ruber]GGQ57240.1 hypothetical protein GCM10010145_28850 [Streptomyces ruber]
MRRSTVQKPLRRPDSRRVRDEADERPDSRRVRDEADERPDSRRVRDEADERPAGRPEVREDIARTWWPDG